MDYKDPKYADNFERRGSSGYLRSDRVDRVVFGIFLVFLLGMLGFAVWVSVGNGQDELMEEPALEPLNEDFILLNSEPIRPVPLSVAADPVKAALGKQLYYDSRLSADKSVSCASCHSLSQGGVDNLIVSFGAFGTKGVVNTLSVFNAVNNFTFFWDGRALTLEEQLDGPLLGPTEMANTWPTILARLEEDVDYRRQFASLYPDGITQASVRDALGTFIRTLITPNARFDRYLRGDAGVLTEREKHGYQLFKDYGCVACHQGVNVGGNMYQVFGVAEDYFANRGYITKADLGRYNVTGNESDRHRFRVPSLRNVALTAPYFHDGSVDSLEQAVYVMARYQLGRNIVPRDAELIVEFLHTLTGEYDGNPL